MNKDSSNPTIFRGTAIVGGMTLISRILGFLRDLLFARLFGAGLTADAFFVAFRIPNLLRSVMAEGALTSGFVPTFTDELAKGHKNAQAAISQVAGFLLTLTILISALGIYWAPEIVQFFAPGFQVTPSRLKLSSGLLQVMFPYLIFVSFVAMVGGALNSVRIYGMAAFAQVVMNIVFILGIFLAMASSSEEAPYIVAWSTVIGGMVQVLVQLPALKKAGFSIRPSFRVNSPAVRSVAKLMLPAIFGAAVYQLTIFINTVFASLVGEGAVSALFYADRVVQFPIGIFSIALASVLLPVLSNAASTKDETGFNRNLINSLRFTSFIIIPVSGFIAFFAEPIVELLFMRGKFGTADATRVTLAVQAYCLGLWGTSCHTMAVRAFIAKKDTVTPVIVGMITLSITIFLSLIFIGPIASPGATGLGGWVAWIQQNSLLGSWAEELDLGHAGIALSASVGSIASLFAIVFVLARRHSELNFAPFLRTSIKTIVATGLTIILTTYLGKALHEVLHEVSDTSGAILMGAQAFGSIVFFLLTAFLLRIPENKETFFALQRLIGGRR